MDLHWTILKQLNNVNDEEMANGIHQALLMANSSPPIGLLQHFLQNKSLIKMALKWYIPQSMAEINFKTFEEMDPVHVIDILQILNDQRVVLTTDFYNFVCESNLSIHVLSYIFDMHTWQPDQSIIEKYLLQPFTRIGCFFMKKYNKDQYRFSSNGYINELRRTNANPDILAYTHDIPHTFEMYKLLENDLHRAIDGCIEKLHLGNNYQFNWQQYSSVTHGKVTIDPRILTVGASFGSTNDSCNRGTTGPCNCNYYVNSYINKFELYLTTLGAIIKTKLHEPWTRNTRFGLIIRKIYNLPDHGVPMHTTQSSLGKRARDPSTMDPTPNRTGSRPRGFGLVIDLSGN